MNSIPMEASPSLWTGGKNDNATLKRELDACQKENKSLNDVVRHIGETVIRHVKSQ